jgi:3-phenylpropionate/trans-cinnamate dioxygenase ferredoxin subunit
VSEDLRPPLKWTRACDVDEVPLDGALHVLIENLEICLVNSRGRLYALLDECSHGQVRLSDGDVYDGVVECYMHGSEFDLVTGRPLCLPASEPVPIFEVRVHDGIVEVGL